MSADRDGDPRSAAPRSVIDRAEGVLVHARARQLRADARHLARIAIILRMQAEVQIETAAMLVQAERTRHPLASRRDPRR